MLMTKQVFVGFQDNRLLSPVSVFFISKVYWRFGESVAVGALEQTLKLLIQVGTGFHRSQMLLTEGNGTQTKRSRRGSDMAELCTTCPCTLRAPSNIEAFPSAIVKSLKITALGRKKSHHHHHHHPFTSEGWWTAASPERALQDAISCPGPLNWVDSWNVLSPCCPGGAIFLPTAALCPSTCHLRSERPVVDLLTAPALVAEHVLYLAAVTPPCWWSDNSGN